MSEMNFERLKERLARLKPMEQSRQALSSEIWSLNNNAAYFQEKGVDVAQKKVELQKRIDDSLAEENRLLAEAHEFFTGQSDQFTSETDREFHQIMLPRRRRLRELLLEAACICDSASEFESRCSKFLVEFNAKRREIQAITQRNYSTPQVTFQQPIMPNVDRDFNLHRGHAAYFRRVAEQI